MLEDNYSAIIIGSGISGLYAALKISEIPECENILLVTKSSLGESNSRYAQGGIAGVLPYNKEDSIKLHVEDTKKAGSGLVDVNVAEEISEQSAEVIEDLINYGIKFDKANGDNYALGMEGAHSVHRILHAGGDGTGRIMETVLGIQALKNFKVKILENTCVTEIFLNEDNEACGIEIFDNKKHTQIASNAIIFATGGLGQLFSNTTNPKVATADGMALAIKCGAVMQDMEFIQFHPTALTIKGDENRFLVSETVRGEGAKLKNSKDEFFAEKYHNLAELAPRDVLTRAIYQEMRQTESDCVYLDMSHLDIDVKKRFPTIYSVCEEHSIDMAKDKIPVSPAAHYSMGGIKIDLNGISSIKNLYAVGETACTSLHGANRLASNSLLECAVTSFNLARHLKEVGFKVDGIVEFKDQRELFDCENTKDLKRKIQLIMWQNAGIIRTKESLVNALKEIQGIEKQFDINAKYDSFDSYELRNMIMTSKIIITAALNREESRGGHFRADFTKSKDKAEHSYLTIGDIKEYDKLSLA